MPDLTDPIRLPVAVKERIFRLNDRIAASARGQRLFGKAVEVLHTSLGAGNHDDAGDRTGENRLIGALTQSLPDIVAVDVGANHGSWTLEMRSRSPRSRIVAVEPGSEAAALLRERVAADDSVFVVQMAIADRPGDVPLFGTDHSGCQASIKPALLQRTTYTDASRSMPSEMVATATVDMILEETATAGFLDSRADVNVVKIDTEGMEFEIVGQFLRSACRDSLAAVQFEFHMHALAQGQLVDDFADLFGPDFALYRLAPRTLIPRSSLNGGLANFFGYSNWVALRRDHAQSVTAHYARESGSMERKAGWLR